MLVDRAEIYVRAGKGGDGCVSFRREKYVPKGGPDGGDGGDGGAVYAQATPGVDTLLDFSGRHHWIAQNGQPGMGKNRTGRSGKDLVLELPSGTLIHDRDTGVLIKDLTEPQERICIAEPGKGGRGNARFARPDHQTPREAEPGTDGRERWLRLELKLIADVGIIGLPNAGKSTLLSRISRARPKIADYPFTTLEPQLGIVELSDARRLVVADLPGLIEGAHAGAGLGDEFLRHVERTRVLLHLIDVGTPAYGDGPPAERGYRTIRKELAGYSDALAANPEIIAANKTDLTPDETPVRDLARAIGRDVIPISAATGAGVPALLETLWRTLESTRAT
jgi:GTP-binding protein